MSTDTYSKPTAPGRKPTNRKKSKAADTNILQHLQGADDSVDAYGATHDINVINANAPSANATAKQTETTTQTKLSDLGSLDISTEPMDSLLYDQSVALDTDSDWESDEDEKNADPNTEASVSSPRHHYPRKSLEHFRIQSVSIWSASGSSMQLALDQLGIDDGKTEDEDPEWREKRKFIEQELIETEQNYCNDLNILCDEIIAPIFQNKLLDAKYKSQITSNLPQIQKFHNEYFLPQLKSGDIIKVFNTSCDFLKIYIQFVNEYNKILNIFAVHGTKSKNKKLYKFLKEKRKQQKPLTNLLIAPVQRPPRYLLLLQDIEKKTPKHYKDYEDIQDAIEKLDAITNHINDLQREIENMSQCLQIQEKLRGKIENLHLVQPSRKFVAQYTFNLFVNGKKKLKLHQIVVFSDMLLVTDEKWKLIEHIKIKMIRTKTITHNVHGKGFELKFAHQLRIYFDTKETMHDTVDEIQSVIAKYKDIVVQNDISMANAGNKDKRNFVKMLSHDMANQDEEEEESEPVLRSGTMPLPQGKK